MTNEEYQAIINDLYRAWSVSFASEVVTGRFDNDKEHKAFYQGEQAGLAWAACYMQQHADIPESEYTTPNLMELDFRDRYEAEHAKD